MYFSSFQGNMRSKVFFCPWTAVINKKCLPSRELSISISIFSRQIFPFYNIPSWKDYSNDLSRTYDLLKVTTKWNTVSLLSCVVMLFRCIVNFIMCSVKVWKGWLVSQKRNDDMIKKFPVSPGPDGLPHTSVDTEFGPASANRRNKKKEPRRHTLANGIDYNMVSFYPHVVFRFLHFCGWKSGWSSTMFSPLVVKIKL